MVHYDPFSEEVMGGNPYPIYKQLRDWLGNHPNHRRTLPQTGIEPLDKLRLASAPKDGISRRLCLMISG